ncbi:MAG: hypothetical protein AAF423_08365 [Pseudomonadota bacterium]
MTSSSVDLTLTAATLLQFAFVDPSEISGEPIHRAYYGSAYEVAESYGAKHLTTLKVVESEHADINASSIIVYQWPDQSAWQAFYNDTKWQHAVHQRDTGFHELTDIYFEVKNTTTINFEPDGLYEIAAFWMNRHNGMLMAEYFENMESLVKAAKVQPLAQLFAVETGSHYGEVPHKLNLLHWRAGREARDAIFTSTEFKQYGYMRALALDRMWTIIVQAAPVD